LKFPPSSPARTGYKSSANGAARRLRLASRPPLRREEYAINLFWIINMISLKRGHIYGFI
jgi:hypothetical protein